MRAKQRTNLPNGQRNPFFGLLPWKHADFCLRREHRRLHGDGVRM